jgi:hypothetical protein
MRARTLLVGGLASVVGCVPHGARSRLGESALAAGESYVWTVRAAHTDEILLAAGDSLDVVLLRDRCGVPVGHGMRGCVPANPADVRARWAVPPGDPAAVRPLPAGRWYFGAGAAGARIYGRRAGRTVVRAYVAGHVAEDSVFVIAAPGAVRVVLEPRPATITPGDTIRFRATARDAAGRIVATLPLPAGWNVVGAPDSLGFAPVAFHPWESSGRLVVRLGRLADSLDLHFVAAGAR